MSDVVRIPPVAGDHRRVGEYLSSVSYVPDYPEGWPTDGYGLPIVEPSADEDPDESL